MTSSWGQAPPTTPIPDRRAARQQARAAAAADLQYRQSVRRQPLPPGVRMIHWDNAVAALHLQPGAAHVQTERGGTWYWLPVAGTSLGWTTLTLTLSDGARHKVIVLAPGEQGMADVGQRAGGGVSGAFTTLGDDPISLVIGLLIVLFMVFAVPFLLARAFRRAGRAHRLQEGLNQALQLR